MKIQLALDRLEIQEAIQLTKLVEHSIDWIEVGTSLIKEFGMTSIKELKNVFPNKKIIADIKTIDNARYEFEMCFNAGADVATVMGVSPLVTIDTCFEVASQHNKQVMIDLLNTSEEQKSYLMKYKDAIFCDHVSKDEQEENGKSQSGIRQTGMFKKHFLKTAVAGGITTDTLKSLKARLNPDVVIIGSAITKAGNPKEAAEKFKDLIVKLEGEHVYE
ncbi:orotidine 5'-phosphate decarboxylase [Neobacillus cucumis]|nr:orotidine 5'-phosphate decarboxylase [Neobacillus cucumis]